MSILIAEDNVAQRHYLRDILNKEIDKQCLWFRASMRLKLIGVLLIVIVLAVNSCSIQSVSPQTQKTSQIRLYQATNVTERTKSPQENFDFKSPYEIAAYIHDHEENANLIEIWNFLNIEQKEEQLSKCGYELGVCTAEIIEVKKDEKAHLVILRITFLDETVSKYLLFTERLDWHFLGLASSESHYLPDKPLYRIHYNHNEIWLILRENWGGGTGYLCDGETWYYVNEEGIKEVLSYPIKGNVVQGGENNNHDFEFNTKVLAQRKLNAFTVNIQYIVQTKPLFKPELKWQIINKYFTYFVWDFHTKNFSMDKSNSTIQQLKGQPIYEILIDKDKALNH